MSYSRCLSLSALLASTFIMPTAAMDLTSAPLNGFPTHTHTYTPVPEPASLANSYKTAAVCFLGFGNCGKDQSFSKGDSSYERNPSDMCREEGYAVTSCSLPKYPSGQCPYDPSLYKSCKDDTARACKEAGFNTSCGSGYIKDNSQICPYNSSYYKCKCNPCDGYAYTLAQATADGYVADGSCNSCGTTKYKRKNNPCAGFLTCECGGQIGTQTCKSGSATKYQVCKPCCENRCSQTSCPAGYLCELETCSNKYCIIGCAVNYTDWCTQPVTDCGALGYTKTADQCPDGYLKCPYGDTVFCPNVLQCTIGDIFYTDNTCSNASNYNRSKTVLGIVVHITDNGKHGQIMAPWPIDTNGNRTSSNSTTIYWSTTYGDISNLPNYEDNETATKDYDSCGNTDKIVAAGSASIYPAAWAARRYAPTEATKGKWCLPAAGIMTNIKNQLDSIQYAISKVGGVSCPNCCMWSSSENSNYFAWYSNFNYRYCLSYGNKSVNSSNYVRPVLEF